MDAQVVYQVAKQLSKEELHVLYNLIKIDLKKEKAKNSKKTPLITEEEAKNSLIEYYFKPKSKKS